MKKCSSMFNACSIKYFYVFYCISIPSPRPATCTFGVQAGTSPTMAELISMDLAVCQCLPIGTCRILHHSRRPFLNSPPYAALIHFMQFMHLYTFILYSVHLCPFGFGVYRKFPGIWTSAPRLANGMERFPVPHLVDFCRICQSILLAVSCWGGVDYQRQKKLKM